MRAEKKERETETIAGRARILIVLSASILISLLLSGCPLYDPNAFVPAPPRSGPEDVLSAAPQITLAWDPPTSGSVASYIVSYRSHGTSAWIALATIPASPQPSYTVLRSTTGTGIFDFAVAAEDASGTVSLLHTSLDQTADPNSGWFLSWGQ